MVRCSALNPSEQSPEKPKPQVATRRTRIAFEAHNHGVDLADSIAEIIAPVLGWSHKESKDSVNAYVTVVNRELAALSELLIEAEKVSS